MKNEVTEVNNPEVATVARFAKTINYKNNTVNKHNIILYLNTFKKTDYTH